MLDTILARPKGGPALYTEVDLKSIFTQCDKDGDGRLSKEELKNAFNELRSRNPGWRANRAIHHADANGDRSVSLNGVEFSELLKYALKQGYEKDIKSKH